jgi:hypothetical protein
MGTGIYNGNEVYWQWWDKWGEGAVGGGGSEWVSWCGGGSIREVVRSRQVIVCGVVTSRVQDG